MFIRYRHVAIPLVFAFILPMLTACGSETRDDVTINADQDYNANSNSADDNIVNNDTPSNHSEAPNNNNNNNNNTSNSIDNNASDVNHDETAHNQNDNNAYNDNNEQPPLIEFAGPPVLTQVFPQVAVANGVIYLVGQNLVATNGNKEHTEIFVVADDASTIPLPIAHIVELSANEYRLAVITPTDYGTLLGTSGEVTIRTPEGEDSYHPVFATNDFTFTGKTPINIGLLAKIYRLFPDAYSVPDLRNSPCAHPAIFTDEETPCPYSSLIANQLDIPATDYTTGFPGLGQHLVEWFAIGFEGYLNLPEGGGWSFQLCSDDGSNLYLRSESRWIRIIDNDGQHAMRCRQSQLPTDLPAGLLPIFIEYYQGPRHQIGLIFSWKGPGMDEYETIPPDAFRLFAE